MGDKAETLSALPSLIWAPAGSWGSTTGSVLCSRSRLPSLASAGMLGSNRNVILLQSILLAWLSISPLR